MASINGAPVNRPERDGIRMFHALRQSAKIAWGVAILGGLLGVAPAVHAAGDASYNGAVVHLVVSSRAGGAYDLYARMLAKVLSSHLPGRPTIVVQNMPGAGGIKCTNYMYHVAARDGTVVAATHSGIETAPLRSPKAAKFDLNKFSWIGSITADPFVGYVWHTAPIKTLADTRTTPLILGGVSVGTAGVDYAVIARDLLGFKLKIVAGYKGSGAVKLAMRRGEVEGTFANGWSSLNSQHPEWLKEGKIRIIVQHGLKKLPELPNVPRLIDFAKNDADRQALTFMLSIQQAAKPYFAPPAIPKARLAALRNGFNASIRDSEFLSAAKRAKVAVRDSLTGEELAALVKKLSETPKSVVRRINGILADFKNKSGKSRRKK